MADAISVAIRCKACRSPDLEERFAVVLPEPDHPDPLYASALVCAQCGAFEATVTLPHPQQYNGTTFLLHHDDTAKRSWLRCSRCGFHQMALAEPPPVRDTPSRLIWLEGCCAGCGRAFSTVIATVTIDDLTPLGQRWRKMVAETAAARATIAGGEPDPIEG